MRYWPVPSVTTTLIFSIRAGLLASTVTPGSTLPLASVTSPAMLPVCCAAASRGSHMDPARRQTARTSAARLITVDPPCVERMDAEHSITSLTIQDGVALDVL